MNKNLRDIDEYLTASEIIGILEHKKELSQKRLKSFLRSDGIARKGCSLAVNAAQQSINSVDIVIKWIEKELDNLKEE